MTIETENLYASQLSLSRDDIKALDITDAYSIHKTVYELYADVRSAEQKQTSIPSGILYADKGGDFDHRQILLLANRLPNPNPRHGKLTTRLISPKFLQHENYAFIVTVNPCRRDNRTGKIIGLRDKEDIYSWFLDRAASVWGFQVNPKNLQLGGLTVQQFTKTEHTVTHSSASFKGELRVTDREKFIQSFRQGIGRGRAFGFGLLQIVPL